MGVWQKFLKRLRYRPGQGVKVKFTALYASPVAYSYQGAGCGTAENGIVISGVYMDDMKGIYTGDFINGQLKSGHYTNDDGINYTGIDAARTVIKRNQKNFKDRASSFFI